MPVKDTQPKYHDFDILWFEDDKKYQKLIANGIESYLNELGYTSRIEWHRTYDNKLLQTLDYNKYDLILTDLNLLNGKKSDALIKQIRSNDIYTDVLLYSSEAEQLMQITEKEGFLERVFRCVGRKKLPDKINAVIYVIYRVKNKAVQKYINFNNKAK